MKVSATGVVDHFCCVQMQEAWKFEAIGWDFQRLGPYMILGSATGRPNEMLLQWKRIDFCPFCGEVIADSSPTRSATARATT